MWRFAILCVACFIAWGADDGWQKVKDLKSGSDIRVFKKGSTKPVAAKAASATDDKLIVALKNEEIGIAKAEIDHVDYRPPKTKAVRTETRTTGMDASGAANDSYSSGYSWGRDGWQTVYQKK